MMEIIIIVAMAKNRVIGVDNRMPWHIPSELQYFKSTTWGFPIIMGRKTFEAIGKPLPGRNNIVVSRNSSYRPKGCSVVASIETAFELSRLSLASKAYVIGGEQIFSLALPYTDTILLTTLDRDFEGDAFFPEFSDQFVEVHSQPVADKLEPYTIKTFRHL